MAKQTPIKSSDLDYYDNLDIHQLETAIVKLEKSPSPSVPAHLHAARQALRNRQHLIKGQVMEFEATNDHHLVFFDSTANFCKLAGNSVIFFTMAIADRIHWRYSVKADTDHYFVSEDGIVSFRSLTNLAKQLSTIGILPNENLSTSELHFYKLTRSYTPSQIARLRDRTEHDADHIKSITLPSSPYPTLYENIIKVADEIVHCFQHLSNTFTRDSIGRRIVLESYEMTLQYYELANNTQHGHAHNLNKILILSRRLQHGMAFVSQTDILHHRETCRILEKLVVIERLSNNALQKSKLISNKK